MLTESSVCWPTWRRKTQPRPRLLQLHRPFQRLSLTVERRTASELISHRVSVSLHFGKIDRRGCVFLHFHTIQAFFIREWVPSKVAHAFLNHDTSPHRRFDQTVRAFLIEREALIQIRDSFHRCVLYLFHISAYTLSVFHFLILLRIPGATTVWSVSSSSLSLDNGGYKMASDHRRVQDASSGGQAGKGMGREEVSWKTGVCKSGISRAVSCAPTPFLESVSRRRLAECEV